MPGYVTKLKKIIKIGNNQEKLLELSHMRAKIEKNHTIFKSIHWVQKILM